MTIKNIVRREEEEEKANGNWISAALAFGVFVIAIVALPKYTARRDKARK